MGVIVTEVMAKSVLMWEPTTERIIIMRLKATPVNILIIQIFEPCHARRLKRRKGNVYMRD